jgi:hypothetical protein
MAAELALDRAIAVIAAFETAGDPYQQVTANFNDAGLSFGPLQVNFRPARCRSCSVAFGHETRWRCATALGR